MEVGTNLITMPEKRKLLVVDDEPSINETLTLIFKKQGYDVLRAHTGTEALIQLRQEQPDFAILDVALPDMSGIDIAIWIRAELPTCKFILFSGNLGTIDALEDAKSKGHEFQVLAKPVAPGELIEAIRHLAKKR